MNTVVTAYGKPGCATCSTYRTLLDEAGVEYEWVDISGGPVELDDETSIDGPTIVFRSDDNEPVMLTRPSEDELQMTLERFEVAPRTIHLEQHDDGSGRYILPLAGGDAFITFLPHEDGININYSEVPEHRRGQGLGAELSHKTLDALIKDGRHAVFGCGYVASVAQRYEPWQQFSAASTSASD